MKTRSTPRIYFLGILCFVCCRLYGANAPSGKSYSIWTIKYGKEVSAESEGIKAFVLYVPNEIIVKFKQEAAEGVENSMKAHLPVEQFPAVMALNKAGKGTGIRSIAPLCRDFQKQQKRLQEIRQKSTSSLNSPESRLLRRMRRAPKNVPTPDLDRIYKLTLDLPADVALEDVVRGFGRDPRVEYAELNYIATIDLAPNDPSYAIQWSLENTGQMYPESGNYNHPPGTPDVDIDTPEAWDIHTGDSDIIVAVVDTGVDYGHRDIDDNMWTEAGGYHGYDFVNDDNYPLDDHGHGTHCAGIIAAEGNNGLDIAGVCWNAKIMALKILNQYGSGTYDDAVAAIYYAVSHGADIISNSWGKSDYSQAMQDAIDYAVSQGVFVVAAAGNEVQYYFPHYPAAMEHVISVAATDSNDQKAPSSNWGELIDICAPGVDILSLRAAGTSMGTIYDDYTAIASGTSMACPHVAGVLALLLSEYPAISYDEILARLLDTADDLDGANPGYEGLLGKGRVNAYQALRFNSEGIIEFDREVYSCNDYIQVIVRDFDIRETGSQAVNLMTSSGDTETVILGEDPNDCWIFSGGIATVAGAVQPENEILEVADGDYVTAGYSDQNYGDSGVFLVTCQANIDGVGADISNPEIYQVTSTGARVRFTTSEPTTARVFYDAGGVVPPEMEAEDTTASQKHDIYLPGLASETGYGLLIEVDDIAGNTSRDDNNGEYYAFSTSAPPAGLHVPTEYGTIQAAIDAAFPGATVWLADGTYTGPGNRNLTYGGKAITVRSENGPQACIIDCEDVCRAFVFDNSGEDANAVIEGITVQNGYADNSTSQPQYGGAIMCYNTNPTIRSCVFRNNYAPAYGYGGAIVIRNHDVPISALIDNCTFIKNEAYNGGGAIYAHESAMNNCLFMDNSAHGGGAVITGPANQTITNCVFKGNFATYSGGGGICCSQDSVARIENCLFKNNACQVNNRGGGIRCESAQPVIKHCLFVDNFAMDKYYGGGGAFIIHTPATIENCIFYGNTTANEGGGMHFRGNGNISVTNCIAYNNYPDQIHQSMTVGYVTVSYSDIQDGYSGVDNIDVDPYFADADNEDFHLKSTAGRWNPVSQCWINDGATSPCIDAGKPSSDWTSELWPHGERINMGTYGGTAEASMSNSTAGNAADINGDDNVNPVDLMIFASDWLKTDILLQTDFNRDGAVDLFDMAVLADNWLWME